MRTIAYASLVIGAVALYPASAQEQPRIMGEWIMQRVIERAQHNERDKRAYLSFHKHVVFENMEAIPPTVMKSETYRIIGKDGLSLEQLIERNGKAVSNTPLVQGSLNFNEVLATRYTFELTGQQIINQRAYFTIVFEPREPHEDLPFNTREDEGINRMSGRVLVDIENLSVWKIEGKLIESFRKMGVFKLNDFSLTLEQEAKFGIVVPRTMVIVFNYSVFGFETHERRTYTYSNHEDSRLAQ